VAFCGNDITYEQVVNNLNVLDYEYYFRLTDMFIEGRYADAMVLFDEILSKGFNALHFIAGLSSHFRDLIVCSNATSRTLAELAPSVAARYDEYCRKCNVGFLYAALAETTACEAAYKLSGNPRLLIEFTLMKLSKIFCPASIPSVSSQPAAAQPAAAQPATQQPVQRQAAPQPAAAPVAQPAVQQPAPQTAPQPAQQTAAPKPSVGGLSIKNIMAQVNADAKEAEVKERREAEAASVLAPITPEGLAAAWQRILDETDKPNLKAGLSAFKPSYDEKENLIVHTVKNKAQKDWIDKNCRLGLQTKLQRYLSNAGVHLEIREAPMTEAELETKPYLPSEKAKVMMEGSQELRDFAGEFQLELS